MQKLARLTTFGAPDGKTRQWLPGRAHARGCPPGGATARPKRERRFSDPAAGRANLPRHVKAQPTTATEGLQSDGAALTKRAFHHRESENDALRRLQKKTGNFPTQYIFENQKTLFLFPQPLQVATREASALTTILTGVVGNV